MGTIGITDKDKVNLSNLHRQSLYDTSDLGKSKVKTVKSKLKRINPNTKVKIYDLRSMKKFDKILKNMIYRLMVQII